MTIHQQPPTVPIPTRDRRLTLPAWALAGDGAVLALLVLAAAVLLGLTAYAVMLAAGDGPVRVTYRTDAHVDMGCDIDTVADCDRELRAAVDLRAWCRTGPGRTHPGARRWVTNYDGLIDALLLARVELVALEVAELGAWWAQSWPGEAEPAWGQSGVSL